MKTLCVIQHTEAEYLGLIEDHLEGRNIRFRYHRPFAAGGHLPFSPDGFDGLVLLGGGPYGVVSGHLLPSLGHELRLTREFLQAGLPVLGIGLGALILSVAAGGGAAEAPLRFSLETALRCDNAAPPADALRDALVLPPDAATVAQTARGEPLIFVTRGNAVGLLGHPGAKRGMMEDLVMEFAETPENVLDGLEALVESQSGMAEALGPLMVGLVRCMGLMD